MSIRDAATNKNSSNLRYLLLIPFLISWYNLLVFSLIVTEDFYLNYVWLNLPQGLSLIALAGAFFYFHREGLRRTFLLSYLGLWLTTVIGTILLDVIQYRNGRSITEILLSNFGWPYSIWDETNPLSALNSLFYSYNSGESDYLGSTVWSPNGGVGFSWLLLTLCAPLIIVLIVSSTKQKLSINNLDLAPEPFAYPYPVASKQHRLGGIFLDAALYLVTFGIGWIIWNLAIWNTGLTPAKQILKMRAYDFRSSKPASFGQMAKRQLIVPNIVGFSLLPSYMIATATMVGYPIGGALMYLATALIALAYFVFDLVVMFRDGKSRRVTDQISGTVILNEAGTPNLVENS